MRNGKQLITAFQMARKKLLSSNNLGVNTGLFVSKQLMSNGFIYNLFS